MRLPVSLTVYPRVLLLSVFSCLVKGLRHVLLEIITSDLALLFWWPEVPLGCVWCLAECLHACMYGSQVLVLFCIVLWSILLWSHLPLVRLDTGRLGHNCLVFYYNGILLRPDIFFSSNILRSLQLICYHISRSLDKTIFHCFSLDCGDFIGCSVVLLPN